MNKKVFNPDAVYQSISNTARITGMSQKWLRSKVKSGELKHIMVGSEYRVNMPALWQYLDELATVKEG